MLKSKSIFVSISLLTSMILVSALTGCNAPDAGNSSGTASGSGQATLANAKIYSAAATACNPLGSTSSAIDYNLGLAARLYYSPAGQPQYSQVEDYMNYGTDLGVDIFFNQVDVIPTYFSEGFPSEAGPAFETPDGTVLIEWFGMRYQSFLRLTANDQPGTYQLASLSDDGTILTADLDGSGNFTEIINNDGEHATQMGCATSTITMAANSQIPIQLDWFQGPRYHLTNMLLWRFIPAGSSLSDPACGVQGINTFFDTTQTPSVPQPYYNAMLARGWSVIPAENFLLPENNPNNPCYPNSGLWSNAF